MPILMSLVTVLIWPGDRFCALVGSSPSEDLGMLRGFINSIVWGIVAAIALWIYLG